MYGVFVPQFSRQNGSSGLYLRVDQRQAPVIHLSLRYYKQSMVTSNWITQLGEGMSDSYEKR